MRLAGQTKEVVSVQIKHVGIPIILHLGKLIVVKNLGVELLLGEPAKIDNEIVTIPHKQLVEVTNSKGVRIQLPYNTKRDSSDGKVFHCKSVCQELLYPKMSLKIKMPCHLSHVKSVAVTPKNSRKHKWLQPQVLDISNEGFINITNSSDETVLISKLEHFADATPCCEVDAIEQSNTTDGVNKTYELGFKNIDHLLAQPPDNGDYLHEISIDPDNILSDEWKNKFASICKRFSHLITPKPGRYNGFFGRVDNSINFATQPPPSIKARLPKYSQDMLKILGEKMDKLEKWGVLRKPEDIGVVPEFVLPSMLTPKNDGKEWRLVTNLLR